MQKPKEPREEVFIKYVPVTQYKMLDITTKSKYFMYKFGNILWPTYGIAKILKSDRLFFRGNLLVSDSDSFQDEFFSISESATRDKLRELRYLEKESHGDTPPRV